MYLKVAKNPKILSIPKILGCTQISNFGLVKWVHASGILGRYSHWNLLTKSFRILQRNFDDRTSSEKHMNNLLWCFYYRFYQQQLMIWQNINNRIHIYLFKKSILGTNIFQTNFCSADGLGITNQ